MRCQYFSQCDTPLSQVRSIRCMHYAVSMWHAADDRLCRVVRLQSWLPHGVMNAKLDNGTRIITRSYRWLPRIWQICAARKSQKGQYAGMAPRTLSNIDYISFQRCHRTVTCCQIRTSTRDPSINLSQEEHFSDFGLRSRRPSWHLSSMLRCVLPDAGD